MSQVFSITNSKLRIYVCFYAEQGKTLSKKYFLLGLWHKIVINDILKTVNKFIKLNRLHDILLVLMLIVSFIYFFIYISKTNFELHVHFHFLIAHPSVSTLSVYSM